jgi:hypothetical protein
MKFWTKLRPIEEGKIERRKEKNDVKHGRSGNRDNHGGAICAFAGDACLLVDS